MTLPLPIAVLSGDTFILALPVPTARQVQALGLNGRPHWSTRARAAKAMKQTAQILTTQAIHADHTPWQTATRQYRFFWKDLRQRDLDNYIGVMKSAMDGIVRGGLIADDKWCVLRDDAPLCELDRANPRVELVITKGSHEPS